MFFLFSPTSQEESITHQTTEIVPTQYHIQTDGSESRFFKYETWAGQFRKETRLEDGSVVGSYGWVDANEILRIYDYVADNDGYRVVNKRKFKVGKHKLAKGVTPPSIQLTSVVPTQAGPLEVPFSSIKELRTRKVVRPRPGPKYTDNIIQDTDNRGKVLNARLERRIDYGNGVTTIKVQPLFGGLDESVILPDKNEIKREEKKFPTFPMIQPRGEGHRLRYTPYGLKKKKNVNNKRHPNKLGRRGKKYRVVRRRRKPDAILKRGKGKVGLDYQTDKFYHREKVNEANPDERLGEYGYIDPLGVRRVVTYSTGSGHGITKEKENDFVGANTYFEATL